MADTPHLALVLIDDFADWEYGLLAAASVRWFGLSVTPLTPGGRDVTSMAALRVAGGDALEDADATRFDGVALIGSDGWSGADAPDAAGLMGAVHARGGAVGGICGGTVALAQSGLLDGRAHTSNDRAWLAETTGGYVGADQYVDTPSAVTDDRVISAPGTAPVTFATEMIAALLPDQGEQLAKVRAMLAAEHKG